MRNYRINWGKFLVIRWLPVSWCLQAIHVLDKSERRFRIAIELTPAVVIAAATIVLGGSWRIVGFELIAIHTLFWLLDSTWLVGFREVYTGFRGKGIQSIIDYINWSLEELKDCDNISAITIYGSICRHKYHARSDFDLRILQEGGSLKTYLKMIKLRAIAIWKYRIPIDLKLVDSVDFLKQEMREDEHPIVPYNKYEKFYNEGDTYEMMIEHPENYLRDK